MLETIKTLCKSQGITLKELEKRIGVANSSIRKWENANPGIKTVFKIAEYFNVSLDYLYHGGEIPITPRDERESTLLEAFRKTDEIGKAKITQTVMNEMERSERECQKENKCITG